jgi:hypothetical protein
MKLELASYRHALVSVSWFNNDATLGLMFREIKQTASSVPRIVAVIRYMAGRKILRVVLCMN